MGSPLSVRFDDQVLERLRRRAGAVPGLTASGLAHRLVDEGLRMAEHPGVVFKEGTTGRRAALAFGPDVWEVVLFLRQVDARDEAALEAGAETFALPVARLRGAVRYYAAYTAEIDAEIEQAEAESALAEAAWHTERRLLA